MMGGEYLCEYIQRGAEGMCGAWSSVEAVDLDLRSRQQCRGKHGRKLRRQGGEKPTCDTQCHLQRHLRPSHGRYAAQGNIFCIR